MTHAATPDPAARERPSPWRILGIIAEALALVGSGSYRLRQLAPHARGMATGGPVG